MNAQTRRAFLTAASATLAMLFSPSASRATEGALLGYGDGTVRAFFQIFEDVSAPRVIGRRYLETYPSESDPDFLWAQVLGDLASGDSAALASKLRESRQRDFHNDDIVILDGWILARSEARTCALTLLL